MTFNKLYFHVGLFLFTIVSFCHTRQCSLKKHPCISEFKLWTLDENRQGFVEISLPAQPLSKSQYSVKLMSKTSMYAVQLFEDPYRNRKYAMCNIALGEDVDDNQPWAIVLLGGGTVIDGVIYTYNYSDSRAQALSEDTGLDDNVLVDNKSLSLSRCGSSYVQSFPTMGEDNDCPTYIDVFTVDDSDDEMEDEPDAAASPPRRKSPVSQFTGITNNKKTTSRMPEKTTKLTRATDKHHGASSKSPSSTKPSSTPTKTTGVVTHRSQQTSTRQHTSALTQPTSPRSLASTKQPTAPPSPSSTKPTSPRTSASTKHQPTSTSSSSSTKPTSPLTSASTKHEPTSTSPSSSTKPTSPRSSASTKHQPTSKSSSASTKPTSPRTSASTKHQPTSKSSSASTKPTSPRSSVSTKHQPTSTSSSSSTKPTPPRSSASTKHQPTSTSSSSSTKPTPPRRSASTKHQPTSTSSSSSTKPTSPRSSASTKQPTSSSSHSPNATEHGSTETSRTEVSSSSSGSTSSVSMTASSPTTSSSPVAPFLKNPVINEVSILVRNDVNNSFIELRGPNMTLVNFSLVVFDGKSTETLFHKRFGKHEVINGSGIVVVHYALKHNHTANDSSVAVALYDNSKWLQHYTDHIPINQIRGLLDSFIVRTTEEDIHTDILENLVPKSTKRIFTVNPSLISGRSNVSISRCGNDTKDPGSFILAPSTIGLSNNCTTGYGNRVQFKLSNANCEDFRSNKALQQSLIDVIVNSVNDKCKCGLSQVLVKERKYICGSLIFEAYLESSFPWQSHLIFHGFRNFVHTSNTVIVGPRSYITDSTCFQDCLPPATKPGSKGDDNVTLTVAVVVSCVGVFLIIAMSVIIYIRRKKRGIVTFRLTNLGKLDTSSMLHEDKDDLIDEDNATFRTISIAS
ncbi:cell wall protein DAN4-like [Haliotis rubra]|uniref:cell wall protein DAN4-like n=1 Tax=Haliotis rubra TaxID=36100 RepID=UPI001EE5F9F2|nr:cell wall protein DAN4-like [Haliotis rubra]XP_046575699.1 cell wall protein DAN4-like [Haliotis rubra]